MQLKPPPDSGRFSVSEEFPRHLQKPTPYPHLGPDESSPRSLMSFLFHLILFSRLCLGLPSELLLPDFPTDKIYGRLLSSVGVICPTLHNLLEFITRIIFGEGYP